MPCALGVAYDGQCGQAWCVKWIPHSMHEKIATGFSDGKYHSVINKAALFKLEGFELS